MFAKCAASVAMTLILMCSTAKAMQCADLALVLAMDASGSVDDGEFALQMEATASAIRSPEVVAAMAAAGTVAIAGVIWGDTAFGVQLLPWGVITHASDAERFADEIAAQNRLVGGNTDLGAGVWAALDLLDDPGRCAVRRIVNVSGDGRESVYPRRRHAVSIMAARNRAKAMDVTINGLALTTGDPKLAEYYETNVVAGPNAFVMEVDDASTFAEAIQRKLLREIEPPALSLTIPPVDDRSIAQGHATAGG
jgi:hypothetical protein